MIKFILRSIFGFFYISGLSALIPFLMVSKLPEQIAQVTGNGFFLLVIAVVLVFMSVCVVFLYQKSWKKTLKDIGFMSFVPGFISLMTIFFGKKPILILLSKIPDYDTIQSLAINYLDRTLPQLWFLALAYIALGIVLICTSYVVKEKD